MTLNWIGNEFEGIDTFKELTAFEAYPEVTRNDYKSDFSLRISTYIGF